MDKYVLKIYLSQL